MAGRTPLSRASSEAVASRLAEITAGDAPVVPGLRAFAAELNDGGWAGRPRLARAVSSLADKLEAGGSLRDALVDSGAPDDLLAALDCGLRAGRPEETLARYVAYTDGLSRLRGELVLAVAYPLLVLAATAALLLAIAVWLVPQFGTIFVGFGTELPALSFWLVTASDWLAKNFAAVVATAVVGAVLVSVVGFARSTLVSRLFRFVPVVGSIRHSAAMTRSTHALAFLVENGVPLPEAVRLAGRASEDAVVARNGRRVEKKLSAGEEFAGAAAGVRLFPPEAVGGCDWTRPPADLAKSLHAIADVHAARAKSLTYMAVSFAEPFALVVCGTLFSIAVVALFMPLIKLLQDLS